MKRTRVSEWKDLETKRKDKHLYVKTGYLLYNGSASFLWSKLKNLWRQREINYYKLKVGL